MSNFLQKNCNNGKALDIGTGFGAFLPVLSRTHQEVVAVDCSMDQIKVASDLCGYMQLPNVKVEKIPKENGLITFKDFEFDTILATDLLEHNLNYKFIIDEIHRILKPNGICIITLPTKHFVYRLLARREVEKDETRGHVYHSYRGLVEVETYIKNKFRELVYKDDLTFIHIHILTKR
ncbi:MAG: class I SAM-dependent methyltransferase [Conexivisphaerales archaeon]